MPRLPTDEPIACAHRTARAGPSNTARKPSPVVWISRPRNRLSSPRVCRLCSVVRARRSRQASGDVRLSRPYQCKVRPRVRDRRRSAWRKSGPRRTLSPQKSRRRRPSHSDPGNIVNVVDFEFAHFASVSLDAEATLENNTQVMDLAGVGLSDRPYIARPSPAGLQ
jgi:hypothetical protein